jgi:large subunit ribosomal protein L15
MQHKRKKVTRKKGTENYGKGQGKKTRGSGSRGGFGMSGTGKRSEAKLMKMTGGDPMYLGKHGFVSVGARKINAVNIEYIEQKLDALTLALKIKKEKDLYLINLEELGFNKLLSKGNAKHKMKITAEMASSNAVEKIKQAGGEVILPAGKE